MENKYAPVVKKLRAGNPDNTAIEPDLDAVHLDKIEAQLGHSLPEDYREFLRDYAGILLPAEFPMVEDGQQREFSIFVFYGSTEESTLADIYYKVQENLEFEDDDEEFYPGIQLLRDVHSPVMGMNWPKELLPIGSDQGGNQICLALSGLRPGAIFFWRSNPSPNAQNLYLIADSFDEFMNLLYDPNEA